MNDSNIHNQKKFNNHIKSVFSSTLEDYNPIETTSIFSSLLLNPDFQSSQYRIEKAIQLSLSFCQGEKTPDIELIKLIFQKLEECHFNLQEDPAEDVFIDTLWFENNQYKVCTGLWEGGIYQTQIFLDMIDDAPFKNPFIQLKKELKAVLIFSNTLIEKNSLEINKIGSSYPIEEVDYSIFLNISEMIDSVTIHSYEYYEDLPTIDVDDLFDVYEQELGATDIEGYPFVIYKGDTTLILPSAITSCIKRLVITFFIENYDKNFLDKVFSKYQGKKLQENEFLKRLHRKIIKFDKEVKVDSWSYAEIIFEFDKGHIFHFIFLIDSFLNINNNWFSGFSKGSKALKVKIEESISKAKSHFIDDKGGSKGCTLLVTCGYGKAFYLGLNPDTDKTWMTESINSHDLDTMSRDHTFKPNKLWRIIESQEQLAQMSVNLINPNGLLNLYAYAKENKYSLVSHESFQAEVINSSSTNILIPFNALANYRQKVNKDTEKLIVNHPNIGNIKVIRGFGDSLFKENDKYDIYIPLEFSRSLLQAVYINNANRIWIEQDINDKHEFGLQFQFFEAAISWIHKIISIIKKSGLSIPENFSIWKLSFDLHDDLSIKNLPAYEQVLNSYSNNFNKTILNSHFDTNFVDGLRIEKNYSEQALILSLVSYICDCNQFEDNQKILKQIVTNDSARHVHLFVRQKYSEHFISDKEEPVYLDEVDQELIKLNMGWSFHDRKNGNKILGIG